MASINRKPARIPLWNCNEKAESGGDAPTITTLTPDLYTWLPTRASHRLQWRGGAITPGHTLIVQLRPGRRDDASAYRDRRSGKCLLWQKITGPV